LREITGFKGEARHAVDRPGELRQIFFDIRKAEKELSWKPSAGLTAGLKQTVDYWVQYQHKNIRLPGGSP